MLKVKNLIAAGASIPTAIKESLGMSLEAFAAKYEFPPATMSQVINGAKRPSDAYLLALVVELGGTKREWRQLLWEAGRPTESDEITETQATA